MNPSRTGPATVSVVIPVYNESEGFDSLRQATHELERESRDDRYEIVLVDDGSTDDSWSRMCAWADEDDRVTLVRLVGNHGSPRATRAGLEAASGDVRVIIPADLQEGIDLVHACVDRWRETGVPVVLMTPKHGRVYERRFDALAASTFYAILRLSSSIYRGISVRAQVTLLDRGASAVFTRDAPATIHRTPFFLQQRFPFEVVDYEIQARARGTSKWGLGKKIALVLDLLVDASSWLLSPWRIAALGYAAYLALELVAFFSDAKVASFAASACLAGTTLAMLSVLGMEIARVHQEMRGRPIYVVRELRRGSVGETMRAEIEEVGEPVLERC